MNNGNLESENEHGKLEHMLVFVLCLHLWWNLMGIVWNNDGWKCLKFDVFRFATTFRRWLHQTLWGWGQHIACGGVHERHSSQGVLTYENMGRTRHKLKHRTFFAISRFYITWLHISPYQYLFLVGFQPRSMGAGWFGEALPDNQWLKFTRIMARQGAGNHSGQVRVAIGVANWLWYEITVLGFVFTSFWAKNGESVRRIAEVNNKCDG